MTSRNDGIHTIRAKVLGVDLARSLREDKHATAADHAFFANPDMHRSTMDGAWQPKGAHPDAAMHKREYGDVDDDEDMADLGDSDEDEDDEDDECSPTGRHRGGAAMHKAFPPRLGLDMQASSSTSSVASSATTASSQEAEPELSRSLSSTRSFDLRTPVKPELHLAGHRGAAYAKQSSPHDPLSLLVDGAAADEPMWEAVAVQEQQQRQQQDQQSPEVVMRSLPSQATDDSATTPHLMDDGSHGQVWNRDPAPTLYSHRPTTLAMMTPLSDATPTTARPGATVSSRAQAPGVAGRLKITLPTNQLGFMRSGTTSLPASASAAYHEPVTPGGTVCRGARDGAADSSAPISPFEPPTPLCQPGVDGSPFLGAAAPAATRTPPRIGPARRSQQKRASVPSILVPRGGATAPTTGATASSSPAPSLASRSEQLQQQHQAQRRGSACMSPLSADFAAVSMRRSATDERMPPSRPTIGQLQGVPRSSGSSDVGISTSAGSDASYPSLSALSASAPSLHASESTMTTHTSSVAGSARACSDGEGSAKARTSLPLVKAQSDMGTSSSPPRPPLSSPSSSAPARHAAAKAAKARSTPKLSPYNIPGRGDGGAPPSLTGALHASVPMQKSQSAPPPTSVAVAPPPPPPQPQTVSARHLEGRSLPAEFVARYELRDELGSGGFGFVVSAVRRHDGRPVAVKFIWKSRVPTHGWVRDPRLGIIPLEAFVLRIVDHPGIVEFLDLMWDHEFFFLVMELHGTPWKAPEPSSDGGDGSGGGGGGASSLQEQQKSVQSVSVKISDAQQSKREQDVVGLSPPLSQAALPSPTVAVFPPGSEVPTLLEQSGDEDVIAANDTAADQDECDDDDGASNVSNAGVSHSASSVCTSPDGPMTPTTVDGRSSTGGSAPPLSPGAASANLLADEDKAGGALRPAPMERRSSCDLFECIEQHSHLPEEAARWVFAQIVEAVYYLDRLGVTHRDIKDENCVIDADFNVKLIDFGSAVLTDVRQPAPYFDRFFGTTTFASSEILQGRKYRAPQAEVWSLGVLLAILLRGECPFADPKAAIQGRITRPHEGWSELALHLLRSCLEVDPDRRATIGQVRQHPWVAAAWDVPGRRRPTA